jgi:hypothetical protein
MPIEASVAPDGRGIHRARDHLKNRSRIFVTATRTPLQMRSRRRRGGNEIGPFCAQQALPPTLQEFVADQMAEGIVDALGIRRCTM